MPAMSDPFENTSDGKIVVTLKAGRDYDAPWIVIHGDSVEDVLRHYDDKKFAELMARTRDAARYFGTANLSAKTPKKSAKPAKPGMPEGADVNPKGKPKFNAESGKVDFFN